MNCLSLNKCLVQTTVSDAALEMKSAAPRGPHVVSFSRGKHPAAGLLSLLTTGGLISVRRGPHWNGLAFRGVWAGHKSDPGFLRLRAVACGRLLDGIPCAAAHCSGRSRNKYWAAER